MQKLSNHFFYNEARSNNVDAKKLPAKAIRTKGKLCGLLPCACDGGDDDGDGDVSRDEIRHPRDVHAA